MHRLERSVEYVTNKDKTVRPRPDSASSLQEAVDYTRNREKTECDVFESAIGCTLETAFEDMLANKKRWNQIDGVQGYHLVQSFAEGELTPELAHRIGLELAEKLLCGKYPAVIATHLNTRCLHNHIVWDSVAMDTGRKYRSNARSYYTEVRALSDRLCRQHGLSVINTDKAAGFSMNYGEWMAESRGQPTWRTVIRQDVDEAIASALTWRQFVRAMEQQGYELRMLRKYPTLKPPGKERPVRFKTLGQRYTPEALQMRILYARHKIPAGGKVTTGGPRKYARLYIHGRPIRGLKGLRALYYRYLYELGALPRKPQYQSYAVRQDIYRLDRYVEQMHFLSLHGIDSRAQLEEYRKPLLDEIAALTKERHRLYRSEPESPRIGQLTARLQALRKENRLCGTIEQHSVEIDQRLAEAKAERQRYMENENKKGVDRTERRQDTRQRDG